MYVPTDWQIVDIFTKPLGLDKLTHFSSALGLQHLDMPNLRRRHSERSGRDQKSESDGEFDFGMTEEDIDVYGGSNQRNEPKSKITEQGGGKAKKGRKANTRTWADMVKGLKEEELETSNLDKSMNVSETTDSVEQFDSNESNHMEAKRIKRQPKKRQHGDNKGADEGLKSRQADRKG